MHTVHGTMSPVRRIRERRRQTASGTARVAVAVLSAAVFVACSSEERFCTLGASMPAVDVDVTALPSAHEVCVAEDECVTVRGGVAELASPVITNATEDVRLTVRDDAAAVLADAAVRLPRHYGNGRECGGDAPVGTVTFGPEGGSA